MWKSPFGGRKLDSLLDTVRELSESTRHYYDSITYQLIVETYSSTKAIQRQLNEIIQPQQMAAMVPDVGHSTNQILNFLQERLSTYNHAI